MSEERRSQLTALALLGINMALWAGNSIVGRAVRFDVPPLTLAFGRWLGASLILLPFAWRGLRREWPELVRRWPWVLALGLLGIGAFNALLYSGLRDTTATNALLLQAAVPATVMALDRIFFGLRSRALQLIGVALSIAGVAVVVFAGDPARVATLHLGRGDALILLAVLVWALYTVLLRKRPSVSATSFLAATFLIGTIAVAPFAAAEALDGQTIHWSPRVVGGFAYVCIFPSIVSYLIYNWAASTVGAARAGQAITLLPIFGAFLSAALLGEALHGYHWFGMALILAGIALAFAGPQLRGRAGHAAGAPLGERA